MRLAAVSTGVASILFLLFGLLPAAQPQSALAAGFAHIDHPTRLPAFIR
jgi:hypothetical protein